MVLVGLVPAAYADPPDPAWIGGYWDDDDFDCVVVFIASTFATVAQPAIDAAPCLVWIDDAAPAGSSEYRLPPRNTSRPRAPPLTSRPLC